MLGVNRVKDTCSLIKLRMAEVRELIIVLLSLLFFWHKYLFDFSLRKEYIKEQMQRMEEDHLPMGFFTDGIEDPDEKFVFI